MGLINELISNIECRDSLILKGVERIRRKELITGDDLLECKDLEVLRLTLSEGDVCFLCLGETDEIEISAIPNDWDNLHVLDLSQQNPWIDLIDYFQYGNLSMLGVGSTASNLSSVPQKAHNEFKLIVRVLQFGLL